jgi:hypothetical protein
MFMRGLNRSNSGNDDDEEELGILEFSDASDM